MHRKQLARCLRASAGLQLLTCLVPLRMNGGRRIEKKKEEGEWDGTVFKEPAAHTEGGGIQTHKTTQMQGGMAPQLQFHSQKTENLKASWRDTHTCTYILTHAHTYSHTHTHKCVHVYIYGYMCMCEHLYICVNTYIQPHYTHIHIKRSKGEEILIWF